MVIDKVAVWDDTRLEDCIMKIAYNGDKAAMEELYRITAKVIYGYAFSILKNPQDAEDVLQDCCLTIFSSAPSYRSKQKPMAWIFTIARNLCLMKFRSEKRRVPFNLEEMEVYLDTRETLSAEDRIILKAYLKRLSDDEQKIVLLHEMGGFKHREIAELLHKPLATVLSGYHRAMKKMRSYGKEGEL